jgi:proline iminopeptidase
MRIEVNGNPLEVDVLGRSGAPTLIAHHGAPGLGSRAEPRNTFGTLTDVMQVVVYDARGSGASGLTPPFTHRQWVADLDGLREHVGAESIVVAGGSYGGFIALEYALAHPQRVRAVILRDTAADNRHDQAARRNAIESSRVDLDLAKFNRIMEGRTWDDQHHATHNFAFTNNMPGYDILDRLTDILCPVLVTVGRDDWIVPVAESEAIAERIPRAQLVVFERSGHSPQIEEAERFQAVMRNFLRDAGIVERS